MSAGYAELPSELKKELAAVAGQAADAPAAANFLATALRDKELRFVGDAWWGDEEFADERVFIDLKITATPELIAVYEELQKDPFYAEIASAALQELQVAPAASDF